MRELDCEYYERRRQECLARADATADAAVSRIHREFAAAYEERLLQHAKERPRFSVWN